MNEYEKHDTLTDNKCFYALDRAKIAVKQHFGFAKNESCKVDADLQGILDWCVAVATEFVNNSTGPTLKEYLARMDKVARSVRHHSHDGSRSYYLFIRQFIP